jgi:hypothetical protein
MKRIAVFLFLSLGAIGCDDSVAPEQKLEGNWLFETSDGLTGMGLTFDGAQYTAYVMELTSSTSANAEVETGSFLTSDTQIVFTPREWSCPGPDSIYVLPFKLANGSLLITSGATLVVFQRNLASPATNFVITTGCTETGTFVPMPVAPVSNS